MLACLALRPVVVPQFPLFFIHSRITFLHCLTKPLLICRHFVSLFVFFSWILPSVWRTCQADAAITVQVTNTLFKTLNKGNTFLPFSGRHVFFLWRREVKRRNGKAFTSRLFSLSFLVCFGFCLQLACVYVCVFECVFNLFCFVWFTFPVCYDCFLASR